MKDPPPIPPRPHVKIQKYYKQHPSLTARTESEEIRPKLAVAFVCCDRVGPHKSVTAGFAHGKLHVLRIFLCVI